MSASGPHPSHVTRISMDASTYDEICVNCGAHDEVPGGWGALAYPCPATVSEVSMEDRIYRRILNAANLPQGDLDSKTGTNKVQPPTDDPIKDSE